ncbi:MAG: hypothetical protein UF228_08090 [Lachnospiraceae bacterium]|nr:hypothetical protein [Lachnospiraceae bacterium]
MNKKLIFKYYYKNIAKSLLTALTCLYLTKFDDIQDFCCMIGFISSVITVSWIRDLSNARVAIKDGHLDDYDFILHEDDE